MNQHTIMQTEKLTKTQEMVKNTYKDRYGNPFILTPGQTEIFDCIFKKQYKRVHCMCFTRYGKSETVGLSILTRITTYPEKWAIVAPSNKKAHIIMGVIIQHIFDSPDVVAQFEIDKGESLDKIKRERSKDRLTFKLPGNLIGEVFILSSEGRRTKDLLDALMGFGAPNVIIDESSLIEDVQYAGIKRMLGDETDNFLFEIGNPFRRNHFLKTYRDPNYHHIEIDCYRGLKEGRITPEFIEEMRKEAMFPVLYENKFPEAHAIDDKGYTALITDSELDLRLKQSIELFGELRLGVDIAGEGNNYSVAVLRGRNGAKTIYRKNNPDIMNFTGVIMRLMEDYNVHPTRVFIDKVGIGKGVYDRLREQGKPVVGVIAGEKAQIDNEFVNKKAEINWRMKEWLRTADLEKHKGWYDLLDVKYKIQSDKKIKIKTKQEMIKDGILSPDCADALALTFYRAEEINEAQIRAKIIKNRRRNKSLR